MSEHTKEPWAIHPLMARIVPADHTSRPIGAHEDAEVDLMTYAQEICAMHWPDRNRSEDEVLANARRIVACVNACEGMGTEYLEKFGGTTFNHFKKMKDQRDKLLAAAKITVGDLMDSYRTHGTEWLLDATRDLRNAIAEIEATK
jgi:hypothetical protein